MVNPKKPVMAALCLFVLAAALSFIVYANGENIEPSANQTNGSTALADDISQINQTINSTINSTISQSDLQNIVANETANQTEGQLNQEQWQANQSTIYDFNITSFTPDKADVGDVMFTIQLQNTGNAELKSLIPIIVGRGFSTYDVTLIPSLGPGEKAEAYVTGQLIDTGHIILTIKVGEKIFYEKITVESPAAKEAKKEKNEEQSISLLSEQLEKVRKDYYSLQDELNAKKKDYDVSGISLEQLKKYIRDAESAIASDGAEKANVSLVLAINEYNDQKRGLSSALKKPYLARIREEILIFSTIAGAVITLFTFYEVMKKKQEIVYKRMKEIKVTKNTNVVENKKEEAKDEGQKKP